MKYLFLTIVLGYFTTSFSQQYIKDELDTTVFKQIFLLKGIGEYSGNAIQNQVVSKLLFGGNISNSSIYNSLENHLEINSIT